MAKQALFAFLEQHRGKVKATYLLAGWTTAQPRQHVVQLVDSEQLTTSRSSLDPVTSMHVYSLQPTQPKVCQDSITPFQHVRKGSLPPPKLPRKHASICHLQHDNKTVHAGLFRALESRCHTDIRALPAATAGESQLPGRQQACDHVLDF